MRKNKPCLPLATRQFLEAISSCGTVKKVRIEKMSITYLPRKGRDIQPALEKHGVSDALQRFVNFSTYEKTKYHFREGTYSFQGGKIEIIK